MNAIDFIEGIRELVLKASVVDTISVITNIPGRRPENELVEVSQWYKTLNELDRDRVRYLLELGAKQAVFGMLSVLDGTRKIDLSQGTSGNFELSYIENDEVRILAGPEGEMLHELL